MRGLTLQCPPPTCLQPTFALKMTVTRIYLGKMLNALIQVLASFCC